MTSQRAALLAGLLALPSAMNGAIFYHYDLDPRNGSHSDAIDPTGEEDVYRITVTGSGTLTVHSTGDTDVYGHLLSSSGSELASNDDDGENRNFQISHSVSAGTYYVRVRHYSTGTGDYSISSSFDGGSHYYGSILNLDDSLKSSIDSAGEEDLYRVMVTESGTLTVHSTGDTDVYGHLLSSSGSELASNDDGGQSTNFRISHSVSAGTYYVRVRHYDSTETGDYTVHSSFTASSSRGGGSSGGGSGGSGSGSDSGSGSGGSSSGGGVGFSVSDWERAVSAGTSHNSILTTPVDTTTHPTHNLSGMAGATAATYEFVVNATHTDQFSPVLLGDNVWWLKFDQERSLSTQVNQLGVTRRGVEDYFFTSISGRSLASPYGRDAHIVYTYDGADTEVFVDGQKVGSLSGQGHIFTDASSELGWSPFLPDSQHNLKGRILAFASYRSVLSDREIQSHYNAAFPSGTQTLPAVPQHQPQPQPTLNPDGDEDNDGLTNTEETQLFAAYNLDPYNADSDEDGTNDGYEDFDSDQVTNIFELRTFHSDPLDAYSLDPNNQVTDSAWLFLAPLDSSSALQLARAWGQIQAGQSSSPTTTLLIDHHETETSNERASIRFTGTTVADGVTHLNFVFTPRNDAEETFDLYFRPGVSGTTYWAWIEVLPAGRTIAILVSQFASPQGFFTGGSRADTDGDGQIDNFSELANNGVYDSEEDFESDNLRNQAEYYLGTNPFRSDSDGDGTNDDEEDYNNDGITDYEDYLDIVVTLEPGYHESSVILDTVGTASELSAHAGVAVSGYGNAMVALSVSVPGDNQLKITSQMFVSRSGGTASSASPFIPLSPRNLPDDPYDPPPNYKLNNHPTLRDKLIEANGGGWSDSNYRVLPRINHDLYDDLSEDFLRKAASEAYYGRQRQTKRIAILIQQGHDENDQVVRNLRYNIAIQKNRQTAAHRALIRKGARGIGKFIPFVGGFILLDWESNSESFADAFEDYARSLVRNDDAFILLNAAILAAECNNLAPGSGNVVLNFIRW